MIQLLNEYLILVLFGLFLILMAGGISISISLMHRLTDIEEALSELLEILKEE